MKWNVNNLLPIALALVMPVLSFYTESGFLFSEFLPFSITWLMVSSVIYIIWHLLWRSWNLTKGVNNVRSLVLLVLYIFGVVLFYEVFFRHRVGLSWSIPTIRLLFCIAAILIIQFALKAQSNIAQLNLEKEQLKKENYKTQLRALQAQVDPHFLFNSLNTLRSMIRQQHPNSEDFVVSLSGFFRQTLNYNENTTIPLREELEVLESYLFLMKSRNEKAVQISMHIDEGVKNLRLPTLALQTVVENCFKHNSMTTKHPLHIEIMSDGNQFIRVSNNKQAVISDEVPSERGLAMLRKRYELLHESQGMEVLDGDAHFQVKLKLLDE